MSLLKIWFLLTIAGLGAMIAWSFAPILIPLVVVTAGLGGAVWMIVRGARWLERRYGRREPRDLP